MKDKNIAHVHPGQVLLVEFLRPFNLNHSKVARDLRIPANHILEIILGKRRITAKTALRLAAYFMIAPQFWLSLQMLFDLDQAENESGARIKKEVYVLDRTI